MPTKRVNPATLPSSLLLHTYTPFILVFPLISLMDLMVTLDQFNIAKGVHLGSNSFSERNVRKIQTMSQHKISYINDGVPAGGKEGQDTKSVSGRFEYDLDLLMHLEEESSFHRK